MIKLAILKNEDPFDHIPWVNVCKERDIKVEYKVIDLSKEDWLEQIDIYSPDAFLTKPSGKTSLFREQYLERLDILCNDLNYLCTPNYQEARIYESKRFFSYWALSQNIPHPNTSVFYNKSEAMAIAKNCNFPIVGKMNIGASGNGVEILKSKEKLFKYILKGFSEGLNSKTGPKLNKGKILKRVWNKIINPTAFLNRLKTYKDIAADKQKGYVILQEYINHDFEWRAVRIGDSYFAHKKLKLGEKSSGSLLKEYDNPPLELFDFVKQITDKHKFTSMAVDIFENEEGDYLVNEMQCIFGQSDPYQMLVDGKPGRYRFLNNSWIFEEGDFAKNQCYDLRIDYILGKLDNK